MNNRCALLVLGIALSAGLHAQAPAMAWEAFFNGSLPGEDEARALIVAPDNTVYVTGSSTNIAPQGTISTLRYASDGTQLWADHPYGPSQDSQNGGMDMAIDPWGHVFVCGNFSANAGDLCVVKYKPSGRIWRRNFEQYPTADVPDEATGIAVDANGEVYVSGTITSTSGMGLESYILKVDSAGNELWHDAFSPSSADETATDIAVSPGGNVFVGGGWWNVDGSSGIDLSTARYSTNGLAQWKRGFSAVGMDDAALRIRATVNDGLLAAGIATIGSTPDAVVVARDASGAVLWSATHAGTGNVDDAAVDVRELSDGRVAAAVHSRELVNGSLRHTVTTLLIDAGTVVWSRQFTGDAGLGAWPTSMIVDAADNIYIAGYAIVAGGATTDGLVLKYDVGGTLTWSIPYDGGANSNDRFNAIALNSAGDVVVCGTSHTSTTESRYVTVQFGNAVGVDEMMAEDRLAVFPNPANDRITITGIKPNAPIEVFDALGGRVAIERAPSINVSTWADGIYFVKVEGIVQRLVVQH